MGKKKEVLVVEDDPVMLRLVAQVIGKKYHVVTCTNALDALRRIHAGSVPHLIISDVSMPGMSGYEFVKNIRVSGLYRNIPIIILSGKEESDTRISFYKLYISNFLIKPFNPEELMVLVQVALGDLEMEIRE